MNKHTARWLLALLGIVLMAWLAAGCAKKAVQQPPAPPPAPPVATPTPTPTPEPTPPPPPPPPAPSTISTSDFQPVFFELDSFTLSPDARAVLDLDARVLRDHPSVMVTIEGHCDERGTSEYNQALGERRAQAAKEYLTAAGIDAARLKTVSYGKERPFDEGHDETAWAKNRRAHFVAP